MPKVAGNQRHQRVSCFLALSLPQRLFIRARSSMTMLIMFGGFMAAVLALTYVEVRRIRKKLSSKQTAGPPLSQ